MLFKPKRIKERIEAIKTDPKRAYKYALQKLGTRWPEAEPYIMQDPLSAFYYTKYHFNRWPEAEPYIMKHPIAARYYAEDILKGKRWPEAEPYIMKDPQQALYYAQRVIKDRWTEAEPYIKNSKWWNLYQTTFKNFF
jgi:hypothetical protein